VFRYGVIAIGGVQITDMRRGRVQRVIAQGPGDPIDTRLAVANEFNLRSPKEWHREIARKMHSIRIGSDMDGERFHEKFAFVPIVERSCTKEEGHRCIDGWMRAIVPCDAQSRPAEFNRLIATTENSRARNTIAFSTVISPTAMTPSSGNAKVPSARITFVCGAISVPAR
jgi:hypothetical protein